MFNIEHYDKKLTIDSNTAALYYTHVQKSTFVWFWWFFNRETKFSEAEKKQQACPETINDREQVVVKSLIFKRQFSAPVPGFDKNNIWTLCLNNFQATPEHFTHMCKLALSWFTPPRGRENSGKHPDFSLPAFLRFKTGLCWSSFNSAFRLYFTAVPAIQYFTNLPISIWPYQLICYKNYRTGWIQLSRHLRGGSQWKIDFWIPAFETVS